MGGRKSMSLWLRRRRSAGSQTLEAGESILLSGTSKNKSPPAQVRAGRSRFRFPLDWVTGVSRALRAFKPHRNQDPFIPQSYPRSAAAPHFSAEEGQVAEFDCKKPVLAAAIHSKGWSREAHRKGTVTSPVSTLSEGECSYRPLEKRSYFGKRLRIKSKKRLESIDENSRLSLRRPQPQPVGFRPNDPSGAAGRHARASDGLEGGLEGACKSRTVAERDGMEVKRLRIKIGRLLPAIARAGERVRNQKWEPNSVIFWFPHYRISPIERELISLKTSYRQAVSTLHQLVAKADSAEEGVCRICFSDLQDCIVVPCGHLSYCTQCFTKDLIVQLCPHANCPTCNGNIAGILQCRITNNYERVLYGSWYPKTD